MYKSKKIIKKMNKTPFEVIKNDFNNGTLKVLKNYFNYDDENVRIIKLVRKKDMYDYTTINQIIIYVPKIDFINSAKDLVLEFTTEKEENRKINSSNDAIRMLHHLANNFEPSFNQEKDSK